MRSYVLWWLTEEELEELTTGDTSGGFEDKVNIDIVDAIWGMDTIFEEHGIEDSLFLEMPILPSQKALEDDPALAGRMALLIDMVNDLPDVLPFGGYFTTLSLDEIPKL